MSADDPGFAADPGTLYVCATPIGNLGDLSARALAALRSCDIIAAERPAHTLKLLSRFGVPGCKLRPCGDGARASELETIVSAIEGGASAVLVTDAGTPGISDPARYLVSLAVERGLRVSPIPGPCAATAALCVSGVDTSCAVLLSFLPRKPGERRAVLRRHLSGGGAVCFFEAPGRIRATLRDLAAEARDRPLVVLREATKIHEEVLRGTAEQVLERLPPEPRGELTVVVAPGTPVVQDTGLADRTRRLLDEGLSGRDAARALMVLTSLSRSKAEQAVREAQRGGGGA